MMMKIILLFLTFILSGQLMAADLVVKFVKGKAYKRDVDEKTVGLKKGSKVVETDTIITESKSLVILRVKGHSTIKIEANTEVEISELPYFYEKSKEVERPASLILHYGSMLFDVKKKSDNEVLKVKTKNTVMGVRGTKFLVSQDENLLLSVKSGLVEIDNAKSGQTDFVDGGESIVLEKNKTFTKRQKYKFQDDINWNLDESKKSSLNAKFKKSYREEFIKKKKPWVQDKKRFKKFRNMWEVRNQRFQDKTKSLKTSKVYQRKIEIIQKKQKKRKKRMHKMQERRERYQDTGRVKEDRKLLPGKKMQRKKINNNRIDNVRNRINNDEARKRIQKLRKQRMNPIQNKKPPQ